ncbi:XF1762 family protein [Streptomyces albidoflavus]
MPAGSEPTRLHLVPVRQKDAKAFVREWHRHHQPPAGAVFSIGAADEEGVLRAVAMAGRPVARHLDDGQTLEVTRTATDGARNANSLLYGAAWRAAKALGYTRLITYTQEGQSGASLRASGWQVLARRPPRRGWDCPSRPRRPRGAENVARTLWEAPPQAGPGR